MRRLERPKDGFETRAREAHKDGRTDGEDDDEAEERHALRHDDDVVLLLLLLLLLSSGTITRPYVLVRDDDDVALDSVFFCVDWRLFS